MKTFDITRQMRLLRELTIDRKETSRPDPQLLKTQQLSKQGKEVSEGA